MTEAEVLDHFRRMYERDTDQPEQHMAHCPDVQVLRFEVTGEGTFESVLKCPHARPLGYSVGTKLEPYVVVERRHTKMLHDWQEAHRG